MQIIHKIDDFLFTIFPSIKKGDQQSLKDAIQVYYNYGPYKPKVTIEDDWVKIDIDTPTIVSQDADYKKVISFCEKGKYSEAKPILKNLIAKNSLMSTPNSPLPTRPFTFIIPVPVAGQSATTHTIHPDKS